MIVCIEVIGCLVLSILAIAIPVAFGYCANEVGAEGETKALFLFTFIEFLSLFFLLIYFCKIS